MFYQTFLSPQVKRCSIITYEHGIYELPHELPSNLKLNTLGNQGTSASPKYPATGCSNKKPQFKLFLAPTISRCPSPFQMTLKSFFSGQSVSPAHRKRKISRELICGWAAPWLITLTYSSPQLLPEMKWNDRYFRMRKRSKLTHTHTYAHTHTHTLTYTQLRLLYRLWSAPFTVYA